MRREVTLIKLAESVDLCLECSHRVGIIRVLDRTEEDATPSAVVVMKVEFALKTEVEEVRLGELENVFVISPFGSMDGDDRVEPWDRQFEHPPEVVVAIIGFVPNRVKGRVDLG